VHAVPADGAVLADDGEGDAAGALGGEPLGLAQPPLPGEGVVPPRRQQAGAEAAAGGLGHRGRRWHRVGNAGDDDGGGEERDGALHGISWPGAP
jgi:hypothetical protein